MMENNHACQEIEVRSATPAKPRSLSPRRLYLFCGEYLCCNQVRKLQVLLRTVQNLVWAVVFALVLVPFTAKFGKQKCKQRPVTE